MRAQSTDGGTALFLKSAGRFRYYGVFSKSEAVRAGVNDLSVLVQRQDKGTVMNATVLLHLEQTESSGDIRRIGSSLKYSGNFHVTSGAMPPKTGLKRNLSLMSLKVAGSFLPILDWLILNKKLKAKLLLVELYGHQGASGYTGISWEVVGIKLVSSLMSGHLREISLLKVDTFFGCRFNRGLLRLLC